MSRGAGIRKVIMVVHIALHLVHDCSSSLRVSVLGALFWLGWNQMTLWFGVTIAHLEKKKKRVSQNYYTWIVIRNLPCQVCSSP